MTDDKLAELLAEASRQGASKAIELHAAALRNGQMQTQQGTTQVNVRTPKTGAVVNVGHWLVIVGLAVTILGGICPWVLGVSTRVSVVEAKLIADDDKIHSIDQALSDLAALKQELTDFRGDFRDWKRENGFGTPLSRTPVSTPLTISPVQH